MSQPYNYYVGNDAQVAFEFTQELNDAATVVGWENGVPKSGSFDTGTGFFTFDVAPANGADVHIVRATDQNVMVATFPNKSYISSDNLDKNNRQLVNLSEEIAFTLAFRADNAAVYAANAAASAAAAASDATDTAADLVATNADVVLTNADVVSTGLDVTYAEEWATKPEDTLVSVAAGGDGVTDYSALHWAAKAAGIATDYVLKAGDTMTGNLTINHSATPVVILKPSTSGGIPQYVIRDHLNTGRSSFFFNNTTGDVVLRRSDSSGVTETDMTLTDDGNVSVNGATPSATNHLTRRDYVDTKQPLLSGTAGVELNQTGTGDRTTFIDLHSSDDASQTDNSARLVRNSGVNGTLVLANKGTGIIQILAGAGSANVGTDGNVTVSAIVPTAIGHLTRKDYVDTKVGQLNTKVIDIGDWNMDTTVTKNVAHGLTYSKIRSISALIRNDGDTAVTDFDTLATTETTNKAITADSTNVSLKRSTVGSFDSTSYDSTSYNRGWIIIQYVD